MSYKSPNLQQVPRGKAYRRCFVPSPAHVFIKADYSQVELRIAAKIADEKNMIAAYARGDDLHTLTAAALTGKAVADVRKDDRQLAKSVNFGLLYGMGAKSLVGYALSNYGVTLTLAEAERHKDTFFRTYPGIRRWHVAIRTDLKARMAKAADPLAETKAVFTLGGRRQTLGIAKGKAATGIYENLTEHSNSPVQGTGADAIKEAVALLHERKSECPTAVPILVVHDEIVVEVAAADGERAKAWVVKAMVDALAPLIAPVPAEVEAHIVTTWGGD